MKPPLFTTFALYFISKINRTFKLYFLLISDVLLTNAYIELHFRLKALEKVKKCDVIRGHGNGNITICMLKIGGNSICKPLEIIKLIQARLKKEASLFTKK